MSFSIRYGTKSLPDQGGGAISRPDIDTGRQEITAGVAQLGAGISDLAATLHKLEGDNQFREFGRQYGEYKLEWEAEQAKKAGTDTQKTWQDSLKEYNTMLDGAAQFMPKNALAARAAKNLLAKERQDGTEDIVKMHYARENDIYRAGVLHKIAIGDFAGAIKDIETNKYGAFDESAKQKLLDQIIPQARHTHQLHTLENYALSKPDAFLEEYPTPASLPDEFSQIRPAEHQYAINLAYGKLNEQQRQLNEQAATMQSTLYNDAYMGADIENIQKRIQALPEELADGYQKTQIMDRVLKIKEAQAKGYDVLVGSPESEDPEVKEALRESDGFFDLMPEYSTDYSREISAKDKETAKIRARILIKEKLKDPNIKTYEDRMRTMMDIQRMVEKELMEGATELELLPPIPTKRQSTKTTVPLEDAMAPYIVAMAVQGASKKQEDVATGKRARDRLQRIWEEMNEAERDTAMQALRRGKTPEEIIRYFNRNH